MNTFKLNNLLFRFLNQDKKDAIKTDYGKALIIASSYDYPFSGLISAKATMLTGVGYLSFLASDFNRDIYYNKAPIEATFINVKSKEDSYLIDEKFENILKYNSILFGNGLKVSKKNTLFLEKLIKEYQNNLIIDASGIRMLKDIDPVILKSHICNIIITPHILEFEYLLSLKHDNNRDSIFFLDKVKDYARNYNIHVLLKSHDSLIVNKTKETYSDYSTSSLAKAGSGDFLAGLLLGFLAYNEKVDVSVFDTIEMSDFLFHNSAKFLETKKLKRTMTIADLEKVIRSYFDYLSKLSTSKVDK